MAKGTKKDLASHRLSMAKEYLITAKRDLDNEDYKASASRSYYAIFHSIRALLALTGIDFRKHSAIISHFNKEYIKSGRFDVKFATLIAMAFKVRNKSDYDDFYVISKEEVKQQLIETDSFIRRVEEHIKDHVV